MAGAGGKKDLTYYSGPLQLIRIDDNGKCHVQENATAILNQITGKLAVVGIAGLYRTGKSFLLNRLLGLQTGFEIGPSVNPCTKGLWIWGQPVQLANDYHCILIDTEGLGSTQRTASCDMQIFSLCILLSSYFIYNSMGAIDEQAIDDLHLVIHLAKHVHVKAKSGASEEKASELANYFPSFLWVLRDFHLQLIDDRGNKIGEKDYLENALRAIPGQDDKNKLRDVIKDLFRDRDCVTVVRPVAEEADLRNIQKLPYESLRPQFRTQVEAFVKKVYTSLKPKKIEGTLMTGPMFASLCSEYCKAINNSVVPTIQSAWTSVMQHQLRLSLKDAVQTYRSQMNDKAMQNLPMQEDKLHDLHKAAKAEAKNVFFAPKFEVNDPKVREYTGELTSRIKQLYEHVKSENQTTSQRQCERIARELYGKNIENKLNVPGSYTSFNVLAEDWDALRKAYLQKTAGPAQIEVLSTFLFMRMTESVQKLWSQLSSGHEDNLKNLQSKLAETDKKSAAARENLDEERNRQGQQLEHAKREWIQERIELERQLEDAKRSNEEVSFQANREKAQLMDSERSLKEQMKILQERLAASQDDARRGRQEGGSVPAGELASLKDAVVACMSEVRSQDMEKKQLELKAEHEKQLIGLERKFQRQLMEARRKNEGLIENLRQTYEDEVDGLKQQRADVVSRMKDLERELEKSRGESETLRQKLSAAGNETALQKRFIESAQRQSELVCAFLEKVPMKGGQEMSSIHEDLTALSAGAPASRSGGGGGGGGGQSSASYGGGGGRGERGGDSGRDGGGYPGANSGAMPFAAANSNVFRNMPGF
mmetsp:Transcript_5233/g.11644  ORF Transcript_5233/g.11644 Transcript_5233/m.11644 type:complete len:821 (-) Transcript_5233:251-2713(-)